MARFRLRFLLQEFDLVGAEVVIGRSPECQITIEDPLVSRQHARIAVRSDTAFVMDLGSRNGVRVNGELIRGDTPLKHNDRVRLGTQDLVFLVVDESTERLARATGFMMNCKSCGRPFPGEAPSCPHCGAAIDQDADDAVYDTMTGMPAESQTSWTLQLLGEVIERALAAGRTEEAERMLRRATQEVEQGGSPGADAKHFSRVSLLALGLAELQGTSTWVDWVVAVHKKHGILPLPEVAQRVATLRDAQKRKGPVSAD